MKISFNRLKQYIDINLSAEEVSELLTNCGLEVESMERFQSVKGGLNGLVIGEVKSCIKHPNADKLSLTTVDIGTVAILNIVCGAPNVAAGQKVVVATVGTKLFPTEGEPFEIKKSKIRGEESQGMICAEDEIGIGKSHEGIIVLPPDVIVGMSAKEYFKVEEDFIFEIGLTPNRADAASHIGVARDIAAVMESKNEKQETKNEIQFPSINNFKVDNNDLPIAVDVQNTSGCPRYSGITLTDVEVKESPSWLKNFLTSIGVHPINNIVDITNFVMHECGQPLHAFDADEIEGNKVVVKNAKQGDKFITLDNVSRTLTADDLMICNGLEPMCIAGVFGGIHSGITANTTNVFIESAYFSPASIRKTSKRHGLKTDASFRFERGTDPEITIYALKHAAMMIKEIAGGKISSNIVDVYPQKINPSTVELSYARVNSVIGMAIDKNKIRDILISFGISIERETDDALSLSIPTYKVDVTRDVDVIEEVLRIYGYNNIPLPKKLFSSLPSFAKTDKEKIQQKISALLSDNGFYEIVSNSLTKAKYTLTSGAWNAEEDVKVLNPLSHDLDVMRQELLYSGLEAIEYNRNRRQSDLKFYEFGKTYHRLRNRYVEAEHLSVLMTGKKFDESWNGDKSAANFFFLKSFVKNIFSRLDIQRHKLLESPIENAVFANGLMMKWNDAVIVQYGSLKKNHLKNFDINTEVFYADFNWDALLRLCKQQTFQFKEVPKFPHVRRDLSMMIDAKVSYAEIENIAYKTEKHLLKEINLFDVYQGDKIEAGKKSYAVSFILQDERQTLTENQIEKIMSRMMEALEKEVGAVIRKQ